MSAPPPRILLVGAGRFGRHHLAELDALDADGRLSLKGVVVASKASAERLRGEIRAPVFAGLTLELLEEVDAAVIATPSATHEAIAAACLPHCDVLVEKPMAMDAAGAERLIALAERHGRVLMPGHVFRFHPVVRKLAEIAGSRQDAPIWLQVDFINAPVAWSAGLEPRLEFIHAFDIADLLLDAEPEVVVPGQRSASLAHASLAYESGTRAHLRMGWDRSGPRRKVVLRYRDLTVEADLLQGVVVTTSAAHEVEKTLFPGPPAALRAQLEAFLARIAAREDAPSGQDGRAGVSARVGRRAVTLAARARPRAHEARPRAAVIGGGVFGATIAEELSEFTDVDLYERHDELLSEVSFANQWRHHSGFHYPRSYDTIQEIRACKSAFESRFEEVIQRDIPSYFATSRWGVEIPAERYLAACSSNYLAFTIDRPPAKMLDPDEVSIAMRTDEAVYDIPAMRRLLRARLSKAPNVSLFLSTEVVGGEIAPDGRKALTANGPAGVRTERYDYVVNATYARINLYANWFGFPVEPLRFDLYEMLVLDIPAPQMCVTVMDAPFCSLVGMGTPGRFLLSHIHDSVLKSQVPADGMPPDWVDIQSNRENMLRRSRRYMPVLEEAKVVESRYATRAVNAFARDFDARPTVVRDHGFGCWSVLGGKILTCLSNAREIAAAIQADIGLTHAAEPLPDAQGAEPLVSERRVAAQPVPVR